MRDEPVQPLAVDDSIVEQMRHWGAPAEDIAKAEALAAQKYQPVETVCEVWTENAPSLQAFLGVQTQWLISSGMATVRTGLNYPGVLTWLGQEVPGRRRRKAIWNDLLVMERAVISADNQLTLKAN